VANHGKVILDGDGDAMQWPAKIARTRFTIALRRDFPRFFIEQAHIRIDRRLDRSRVLKRNVDNLKR
jgi:hypothetical protein